jgi:hypothetical protein
MTPFTRQLGAESGVQLNPLRDDSGIPVQDNADQVFAIMGRFTRGRIDKSFKTHRGNVKQKLGKGEQTRVSALNEAWIHVVEALNNGAYEAVVQRIVTDAATVSYAVASIGTGAVLDATVTTGAVTSIAASTPGTGYTVGQELTIAGVGTGATATVATIDANGGILTVAVGAGGTGYVQESTTVTVTNPISFYVSATIPTAPYLLAVKHLECFNDGIKLEFRAEENRVNGANAANSKITLIIRDKDDELLYEFYGSLVSTDVDDYGNSLFLTDVVANRTDAVEVTVGSITSIATTSPAYGYSATTGQANWAKSATLVCFSEGGTAYTTANYMAAREKLQYTPFDYAYISSGGTQAAGLLAQLAQLAFDTNRQLRFDVPGSLTVDAAVTFVEQMNFGGHAAAHLLHAFWAPLKTNDPTGLNGKGYFGVATLNIALACRRNAQRNAKGFAPKNYPIAGKLYPINRMGIIQTSTPKDQDLNALARAKINPCVFETYTGGGLYVFRDSLTSATVESSLKKLIAVADMSTSIDDAATRYGKDVLHLPMDIAIKRTRDFLQQLFENAQTSDWLVPSNDPGMNGSAFKYEVVPNAVRPYDHMDVSYWLRYVGTNRQITFTQTLSR